MLQYITHLLECTINKCYHYQTVHEQRMKCEDKINNILNGLADDGQMSKNTTSIKFVFHRLKAKVTRVTFVKNVTRLLLI